MNRAGFARQLANSRPNGLLRRRWHRRAVEAGEFVVRFGELKGFLSRPDFIGDAIEFVIKEATKTSCTIYDVTCVQKFEPVVDSRSN